MKNSKILIAICLILSVMMTLASCDLLPFAPTTHECSDVNKDHKCDVCTESMGKHADANKDHVCDYGCSQSIGVCEDVDLDHVCDYGCTLVIGECADADLDHACDYGCGKAIGECTDADLDHACDYGCGKSFGECADADLDHACDYGCDKTFGEHADADFDHSCDYGCTEGIGECSDADKDHACDYGCSTVIGEHADTDLDHACDYGCAVALGEHADEDKNHACDYGCAIEIGTCEDTDKDHACDHGCDKVYGEHVDADKNHVCDYGCDKAFGECEDADKDHVCDYGCDKAFGECVDADKDHACDYGCDKVYGECVDADKDHACDYGCDKAYGECVDADKDHACDYGCDKVYGECKDADLDHACDYGCGKAYGDHADSATDDDHVCDYGCKAVLEDCSDVLTDADHVCDVCGKENITTHVYGEWTKNDADTHKQTCNCGDVLTENHKWNDGEQTEAPTCTDNGVKTYTCTVCNETKTESVDALGHDIINHEAQAPTCTQVGWDAYESCSACDYNTKVEKKMLPHGYGWIVDQQPTLDADGIKHEECSVCGEKRNENTPIDKLTCSHSEMTKIDASEAACLNDGNKEYYFCSGCNKYYSNIEGTLETTVEENVIPALGHDMVIDKAVDPDCVNTGLTEGSHCSRCDHKVEQDVVPALGHDMVTDKAVAPDCVNTGLTEGSHCSRCDHKVEQDVVPALGHDMVTDKAVAPDCVNTGLTEGSHCSRCDYKVAQEIAPALGHNLVTSDAVAPTCMNTGLTAGEYCTRCDYKIEQVELPVVGHVDANGDKHCDYAGCDVVYYVLTLDGEVSVVSSSDRSSTYPNAYLPGTELTLVTDTYQTINGKTYMLVGFDLNTVDNRLANDGRNTVTFTMPAADSSITAKYKEANTTFFADGTFKGNSSSYKTEGWTGTKIENSEDVDLEGLSGYSFVIPDNTTGHTSTVNNVTAAPFSTWGIDQNKMARFVLKNHGNYDVTVEIHAEYWGLMVRTGDILVPANSVVVAFLDMEVFMGQNGTVDMGIHVRKTIGGDGSGTIQLDVVGALAKKYEIKATNLIESEGPFMHYGEPTVNNVSHPIEDGASRAGGEGYTMLRYDTYGTMHFFGDYRTNYYARVRADMLDGDAINLQTMAANGEKLVLYIKVTNLTKTAGNYSLVASRGNNDVRTDKYRIMKQDISFTSCGQSFVYRVEVDPTVFLGSTKGTSANMQLGLMVNGTATSGKTSVVVQIASENIFGEEPVNQ